MNSVRSVEWLTCLFHYGVPVGSYLVSNSGDSKRHSVVCLSACGQIVRNHLTLATQFLFTRFTAAEDDPK